jgi:predicted DNA-binding transcriptional regulator YafY
MSLIDEQGPRASCVRSECSSGARLTLGAWCEQRSDFRHFRIDRITSAEPGETFTDEPGQTLRDLLARYGDEALRLLDR